MTRIEAARWLLSAADTRTHGIAEGLAAAVLSDEATLAEYAAQLALQWRHAKRVRLLCLFARRLAREVE